MVLRTWTPTPPAGLLRAKTSVTEVSMKPEFRHFSKSVGTETLLSNATKKFRQKATSLRCSVQSLAPSRPTKALKASVKNKNKFRFNPVEHHISKSCKMTLYVWHIKTRIKI